MRAPRLITSSLALLMAGCGSSSSAPAPSAPSSVATPTPSTAATPGATSASLPVSCRALPPATGNAAGCHQEASDFLRAVTDAVSNAQGSTAVDPDTGETFAILQNGVLQGPNAYFRLIVDALDRQGICAVYDGEELNVRTSSGFNEHFDIVTSSGGSWVKYMSTCSPALPIPSIAAPPVQDSECRLPPSRDTYCDRPTPRYDGDVSAALDELIAQDRALASPLVFDFRDRAAGTDAGFKVANTSLYFSEMRKKLRTRGYCSVVSGEDELLIKKGTNRLSEHWDLLTGDGHSLRLMAAACRDAAF